MTDFLRNRRELVLALACLPLLFVPWLKIVAGFLLVCVLPGAAICRRWLGISSLPRLAILGSLTTLGVLPAAGIPLAIVWGRPNLGIAVLASLGVTLLASLGGSAEPRSLPRLPVRGMALLAVVALIMQAGMSFAVHPSPDTIQWKGLPDLIFFQGIYTQIANNVPPLDPDNGASLLVHNWLNHFHYVLLQMATGVSTVVMQRLVSAWIALAFLGLVFLLFTDVLKRPAAGWIACLFLMTSGEVYWLVRSLYLMSLRLEPFSWAHAPFGLLLLFAWYNIAPLAMGLFAWYWFGLYRESRSPADLTVSILGCVVMAYFHPIFYGLFMIGFCLWLIHLTLKEGVRPLWFAYLATPFPFLLTYHLYYYGGSVPPSVIHFDHEGVWPRLVDLVLLGGVVLLLGALGLLAERGAGPLGWLVVVSILMHLLLDTPNPHWINDLLYIALALTSGLGIAWLVEQKRLTGVAVAVVSLMIAVVSMTLATRMSLTWRYQFSPEHLEAAEWIRSETDKNDLIAVRPNGTSAFTVVGKGERRLVFGWTLHLHDFHSAVHQWAAEVEEMFTTDDPDRAAFLARHYRADYIYIGHQERQILGTGIPARGCFPVVFSNQEVEIRSFAC